MKDASFDEFVATIRKVASGAEVLPQALTSSLFSQITQNPPGAAGSGSSSRCGSRAGTPGHRAPRRGLSNKEIAARMHIAVHTVKSHVHNVLEKLALHSRLEVAAFSHAMGGIKPSS